MTAYEIFSVPESANDAMIFIPSAFIVNKDSLPVQSSDVSPLRNSRILGEDFVGYSPRMLRATTFIATAVSIAVSMKGIRNIPRVIGIKIEDFDDLMSQQIIEYTSAGNHIVKIFSILDSQYFIEYGVPLYSYLPQEEDLAWSPAILNALVVRDESRDAPEEDPSSVITETEFTNKESWFYRELSLDNSLSPYSGYRHDI